MLVCNYIPIFCKCHTFKRKDNERYSKYCQYVVRGKMIWFGLVSLFNGISTFVGYLMPTLFSLKNSSGTI